MSITRKKIKKEKGKKKIGISSKVRAKPKVKDEVCVIDDVLLTEQRYCCDDECCCLW